MSDAKTGGLEDLYRRAMVYKAHFRLLVILPVMALFMWLLPYLFGVNPLVCNPYVFYASIVVVILCLEGFAFLARKYDLINNKEIPEPFVRAMQYLLMGIMLIAILINTYLPEQVLSGSDVMRVIFQATLMFIIFTPMYALVEERRIKKRKLNTQLS